MSDTASPIPAGRRRLLLVVVLAVVVALVAGGLTYLLQRGDDSRPKAWDPRIEPYVRIVEKERGLTFEHPVAVRFLSAKAFEKTVRTERADLDADERREVEETTSLFRAFGLISGDVDLFKAFNDASGSGTLAYYSFDHRSITVKGTKLERAYRATLVHELTHALQDQRFGVGDLTKKLGKKEEKGAPSTAAEALQALVEGDAERVATRYRQSLSQKEQDALTKAEAADQDPKTAYKGVPGIVVTLMGAPYALGQALAETVSQDQDRLDDLLRDPPPDDSVLLDPLKAIKALDDPAEVAVPAVRKGEKKVDTGQIGSLVTYLMLAQRIPPRTALAAADTWKGDAYVGFRRDGVVCARVTYATGSASQASTLTSAFDDWIARSSATKARVRSEGSRVSFESCDPGKRAKVAKDTSEEALGLVAARDYLGAQLVRSGASVDVARCFAGRVVDEYTVDQLNDPAFGAKDPAVGRRVQQIAVACRDDAG